MDTCRGVGLFLFFIYFLFWDRMKEISDWDCDTSFNLSYAVRWANKQASQTHAHTDDRVTQPQLSAYGQWRIRHVSQQWQLSLMGICVTVCCVVTAESRLYNWKFLIIYWHFETGIARSERHEDGHFEDRIILPVSRVVALEETSAEGRSRAGKLCQVEVGKPQLLVGTTAFHFLFYILYTIE